MTAHAGPDPYIAGLILAGGASSRIGSPKALLDYAGETFLDRLIGLLASVCGSVTVVLGYHAAAIHRCLRRAAQGVFVLNPDPALGQLSSLQCGLRAIPFAASHALFLPVDLPAVSPETIQAITRWKGAAQLVLPRYQGRNGHPVLASRTVVAELLALPPAASAKDVIHQHRAETQFVETADAGILFDVDDAEAYRRLISGAWRC